MLIPIMRNITSNFLSSTIIGRYPDTITFRTYITPRLSYYTSTLRTGGSETYRTNVGGGSI